MTLRTVGPDRDRPAPAHARLTPAVRRHLPEVAVLLATFAKDELDRTARAVGPEAPRLLETLVLHAPVGACRAHLELVRDLAGIDPASPDWPLDALETSRTLERFLDQPGPFLDDRQILACRALLREIAVPWDWVLALAEARLSWRYEPRRPLRAIVRRLNEEMADPGRGPKPPSLDPIA